MSDGPADTPVPAGRRPVPVQVFATGEHEPVTRRPTDALLVIVGLLGLAVLAGLSSVASDLEADVVALVDRLPGVFDLLWGLLLWWPIAWAAGLLMVALVRRRTRLAAEVVLAVALAAVVASVVAALLGDGGRSVVAELTSLGRPPSYPPGLVVLATTVIVTCSPHLTRPLRHVGRWALGLQWPAAVALAIALPSATVAAAASGLVAAALAHLAFGSPGGRPSAARISLALDGLGVRAEHLSTATMPSAGVVRFEGRDRDGPFSVRVYGRDAWDAQLLATLWRLAWYRGGTGTGTTRKTRISRVELVEHEAFVTLLAERAGAAVPSVVTAGSAGRGDALVVLRPVGVPLVDLGAVSDGGRAAPGGRSPAPDGRVVGGPDDHGVGRVDLGSLWQEVARLHRAGIVHGRLDLDALARRPDGRFAFADLAAASVTGTARDREIDRAQVLVVAVLLVGVDDAVGAARAHLGADGICALLPYVQDAAMPPLVRRALDRREVDLDDVRAGVAAAIGVDEQPIIRLRRVTWGSLLNLALLSFAAYSMIGLAGGLDLEALVDAMEDVSWAWLLLALLLAQLPRFPSAVSTMGSLADPLPFGPLAALQFAITYVNLALPSTAARVAINVRFFERLGTPAARAVAAGAIDGVAGFVVQVVLFVALVGGSDLDLSASLDTDRLDGLATVAAIVLVGVSALGAVVACVPSVRSRIAGWFADARASLVVLRSPEKLLQLFGGNLLGQVLFAVALATTLRAFGVEVSLTELLLINTVVSLFAGLLPVPGGIGVTEAGLTLGLTRVGVDPEVAFAAALMYRMASFYLPPIWGWFCYRWLVRERYL
ncbi:MAG: flippase-like domain-containing protein [Acidimicrobiales bacterium]|nr:flippase-like domain-containing protein [Acidimicrobiales bacterium]